MNYPDHWTPAHHVDLVMIHLYKGILKDEAYNKAWGALYKLIYGEEYND